MNKHQQNVKKIIPYRGDANLLAPIVEIMTTIYDAQMDLAIINTTENESIELIRQRLLKVYDQLVKQTGQDPCERFATYTTSIALGET